MKTALITLTLAFIILSTSAQNLTLAELQTLCKLSNWESGSQTLQRKGWEYHDSKRGDSWQYSIITFAHSKDDYYEDRASAWFTFYTYDNRVDKIHYTPPSQTVYRNIVNALSANGYKRIDNEINDDNITVTYSSPSFMLVIKTETTKHAYNSTTFETNRIYLTRKGGIYDEDNGEKIEYWYSGGVKERYTLKDGKKNGKYQSYYSDGTLECVCNYVAGKMTGTFTLYHENGNVKYTGTMLNGKKNGLIIEYDDDGSKISEANYTNGVLNGKYTFFHPNGKIKETGTYLNGKYNGLITEYEETGIKSTELTYKNGVAEGKYIVYDADGRISETGTLVDEKKNGQVIENGYDDDGKLALQIFSNYINGEKHGLFETKVLKDGKWRTVLYSNYDHGTPNGPAKEWEPNADTVVFCNYKDGELDGKYQVKGVFMNLAGVLSVDDDALLILTDGQYSDGKKTGYWTYKNSLGQITEEGLFEYGEREGEWKFYKLYFGKFGYNKDSILAANMNMQISSIENYQNGQLHGQLTKFRDKSSIESFSDSVEYIANYKNGTLHGHYEKHSLDGIITISGNYYFGKKDGQWKETDSIDNTTWITEYRGNFYNGKREQFDNQGKKLFSFCYSYNKYDGIQIKYNNDNTKNIEETFEYGQMKRHIEYADHNQKKSEFELKSKSFNYFNGVITTYYTESENSEISKIVTGYQFNQDPSNVLTKIFDNGINYVSKHYDGNYQVYDRQNRIIVDGMYLNGKKSLVLTYTFYNQNLYYNESYDSPLKFYTLDTKQPYSGKFIRTENKNGRDLTATYKIKKSLIEEIIYSDITTGKTVFKEKFKDGLKKD